MGARPLSLVLKRGYIPSIPRGRGCSTGPHVPSNPLQDPNAPRAAVKTYDGSAPIVIGHQAGTYSIHSKGTGVQYGPTCAL